VYEPAERTDDNLKLGFFGIWCGSCVWISWTAYWGSGIGCDVSLVICSITADRRMWQWCSLTLASMERLKPARNAACARCLQKSLQSGNVSPPEAKRPNAEPGRHPGSAIKFLSTECRKAMEVGSSRLERMLVNWVPEECTYLWSSSSEISFLRTRSLIKHVTNTIMYSGYSNWCVTHTQFLNIRQEFSSWNGNQCSLCCHYRTALPPASPWVLIRLSGGECSSDTLVDFWRTSRRCFPEDRTPRLRNWERFQILAGIQKPLPGHEDVFAHSVGVLCHPSWPPVALSLWHYPSWSSVALTQWVFCCIISVGVLWH
jgi:hypothetical protein